MRAPLTALALFLCLGEAHADAFKRLTDRSIHNVIQGSRLMEACSAAGATTSGQMMCGVDRRARSLPAEVKLFAPAIKTAFDACPTARGFESWAELFLAFILARPEVTCVLPATAKVSHLREFLRAGNGPELDEEGRSLLLREL